MIYYSFYNILVLLLCYSTLLIRYKIKMRKKKRLQTYIKKVNLQYSYLINCNYATSIITEYYYNTLKSLIYADNKKEMDKALDVWDIIYNKCIKELYEVKNIKF